MTILKMLKYVVEEEQKIRVCISVLLVISFDN